MLFSSMTTTSDVPYPQPYQQKIIRLTKELKFKTGGHSTLEEFCQQNAILVDNSMLLQHLLPKPHSILLMPRCSGRTMFLDLAKRLLEPPKTSTDEV